MINKIKAGKMKKLLSLEVDVEEELFWFIKIKTK
jgi:hypothetical protein